MPRSICSSAECTVPEHNLHGAKHLVLLRCGFPVQSMDIGEAQTPRRALWIIDIDRPNIATLARYGGNGKTIDTSSSHVLEG